MKGPKENYYLAGWQNVDFIIWMDDDAITRMITCISPENVHILLYAEKAACFSKR
jgi:hypothetical protein